MLKRKPRSIFPVLGIIFCRCHALLSTQPCSDLVHYITNCILRRVRLEYDIRSHISRTRISHGRRIYTSRIRKPGHWLNTIINLCSFFCYHSYSSVVITTATFPEACSHIASVTVPVLDATLAVSGLRILPAESVNTKKNFMSLNFVVLPLFTRIGV